MSKIKTGKIFSLFSLLGCDLMNLKFLIVLTIVLSAFCIIPVNAASITYDFVDPISYYDVGTTSNLHVEISQSESVQGLRVVLRGYSVNGIYTQLEGSGQMLASQGSYNFDVVLSDNNDNVTILLYWQNVPETSLRTSSFIVYYTYGNELPNNDFNIDIDLQDQTLELGIIDDLDQSFGIGSSSDRVVKAYTYQSSQNCIIFDLQRNFVNVQFNKNNNQALIYLTGTAQKGEEVTDFVTTVHFNYTFEEKEKIDFEIESIDYDKGIQLIGTNLTVYYYHELDDMIEQVYHNDYSDGLTRIELLNNTDIFIEFELNGYNAVNGQTYDYLQNKYGVLTNTKFKSQRLYFSKIDPSVLLFQGFIIKDSLGSALSGVSVTMDNNQTVLSNNYGGVRFDNINQGSHTFVFSKTGYYSQSLTKTVSVSNTQDIQLLSSQPTTTPTVKPTAIPTDSQGNIIIDKPNNLSDSVKYGLAKLFGVTSIDTINLIFALMIILFPAVVAGVITNQALAFVAGGMIGFVFCLAIGLIPLWVFFSMVMLTVIYLVLNNRSEGF